MVFAQLKFYVGESNIDETPLAARKMPHGYTRAIYAGEEPRVFRALSNTELFYSGVVLLPTQRMLPGSVS